jgi:c-di-GMP-binding flagellar brake protein YcgR
LSNSERRKCYRIQDILAIEYQVLSPEEYESAKIHLQSQPSGVRVLKNKYSNLCANELNAGLKVENFEDPDLIRGLVKLVIGINEKVDLILSHLEKKEDLGIYRKPPQEVNLSADGIGFDSFEHIPVETYIKLRMLLSETPQILITTLGKVVWIKTKQMEGVKKFEVGVLFLDIHEDDQEAVIKHIFTRQRDMLRNRV